MLIQNIRLPSFFWTRTTMLAHRLCDFLMAPISSISWRCAFTSSYIWGLYVGNTPWRPSSLLTWSGAWSKMFCLDPGCCGQIVVPIWVAAPWPVAVLLWATPQGTGGFNASRIHPFCGPQVDPPKVSVGRTTSSTWLAGTTLPMIVLAGTSMGWALRFLRQIGTWEDLRSNSPRGWTSRIKSSQNPELILETWAPESINSVTFCPSMITGASLDHPTRQATGSGFKNGMTGAVYHGSVCQAAIMWAGLCPGLGWECMRPTVGWGNFCQLRVSCIPSVPPQVGLKPLLR